MSAARLGKTSRRLRLQLSLIKEASIKSLVRLMIQQEEADNLLSRVLDRLDKFRGREKMVPKRSSSSKQSLARLRTLVSRMHMASRVSGCTAPCSNHAMPSSPKTDRESLSIAIGWAMIQELTCKQASPGSLMDPELLRSS